jgi:hypothetical protein
MKPALNAGLVGQPPRKVPDIRLLERAAFERLRRPSCPSGAARSRRTGARCRFRATAVVSADAHETPAQDDRRS